jgi:hypothetical protein
MIAADKNGQLKDTANRVNHVSCCSLKGTRMIVLLTLDKNDIAARCLWTRMISTNNYSSGQEWTTQKTPPTVSTMYRAAR